MSNDMDEIYRFVYHRLQHQHLGRRGNSAGPRVHRGHRNPAATSAWLRQRLRCRGGTAIPAAAQRRRDIRSDLGAPRYLWRPQGTEISTTTSGRRDTRDDLRRITAPSQPRGGHGALATLRPAEVVAGSRRDLRGVTEVSRVFFPFLFLYIFFNI